VDAGLLNSEWAGLWSAELAVATWLRVGPAVWVGAGPAALPLSIPAGVVVDDSATRQELAVERRELRETLADTVRWLAARGLVTARQAGALAG
jgi:hypothetical protein